MMKKFESLGYDSNHRIMPTSLYMEEDIMVFKLNIHTENGDSESYDYASHFHLCILHYVVSTRLEL